MPNTLILLNKVVSMVGQFPVLAGVSLRVDAGEVVLIEGPNGAGKSSLLRLCAGLLPVSRGNGQVFGFDLQAERAEVRSHVGLLGHSVALYDELTVRENLVFQIKAARGDMARIPLALELLGLTGRLVNTRAGSLSAGQRRRAAIAILVARNPDIWLLDEPHASLDAQARSVLDDIIVQAAASGTTVLVASHEPDALAGRVVSVSGGVVVHDTAADIDMLPMPGGLVIHDTSTDATSQMAKSRGTAPQMAKSRRVAEEGARSMASFNNEEEIGGVKAMSTEGGDYHVA